MSNYLVACDGCGQPAVINDPVNFACTNCGLDLCTIEETPRERRERVNTGISGPLPITYAEWKVGSANILVDGEVHHYEYNSEDAYWLDTTAGTVHDPSEFDIFDIIL